MSSEASDADYVCTLDERSIQVAKDELNEDPKERLGAVQALRKWALEQNWLKTPTDTLFLLSFLRGKKFSQLAAREVLTNYWTVRTELPEWFHDLDPSDPSLQAFVDTGFMFLLPGVDKHGTKIIVERPGIIDPTEIKKEWGSYNIVFRTYMILFGMSLMDETVQVNGLAVFSDTTDAGPAMGSIYNMQNMKKAVHCWQNALPVRWKGIHFYRISPLFEALITAMKPFLREKLRDRLHTHGKSMVPVYDHIDKCMLPREYLPDDYVGPCSGTVRDCIDHTKRQLQRPDVREFIKKINCSEFGVDLKIKPQKNDIPAESFRKLNIE